MEKKLRCLLFYYVKSADRAKEDVEHDLKNWQGREFYSDFTVGKALPYEDLSSDVIEYLRNEHEARRNLLAKELYSAFYEDYPQESQRMIKIHYGQRLKKLGAILAENFCEDMPWFNTFDWSLPAKDPDDNCRWYAVWVDFYW